MKKVSLFVSLCAVLLSGGAFAQRLDLWNDVAESAIAFRGERLIVPVQYRTLALNMDALVGILNQTPLEGSVAIRTSPAVLSLPLPDGGNNNFRIIESPIMAHELAARYPEIKTYLGQGIDDPTATVRFDVTPAGFHAMILSAGRTVYIDPYSRGNIRYYISYFKQDVLVDASRRFEEIGVLDPNSEMAREISRIVASGAVGSIGEQLRTYRLALASTGEYTIFHGGTVAAGLAAMVTAMNRVNGIYEREVSVRMELIANNDQLVYTNPSTDPYTNNNGGTMLGQNQSNLDNVIGSANYDIGHVFSTGGGGVAGLGVVCRAGQKARGVTGLSAPIGDPFYVDYVAHEMGHQFGGNHSFNGNAGSCGGGNRNGSTAYEPGSGTTIMAYAGICGAHNTQNQSDDYFHGISIDEIVAYTTLGAGNSCPVITPTGNNPPVVNAGAGYTIPIGTPFFITGSATDPDGDLLTFTWEEFDLGPAGHPNTPSGNAPIFRSFKGTGNATRIFPRMLDILSNTQTIGEVLPSYARTLNFRLTARDNRAGGGGVEKSSTTVVVSGSAGPFSVTAPNTSVSWLVNSVDTVKWDVANSNFPPVNCSIVNILLSTDGGQTFPMTLAANTPNDGAQPVAVPNIFTLTARVKIEAVNNIFFDISNVNFALAPVASPALVSPPNNTTDLPTSLTLRWRAVSAATSYHLQLSRDPAFGSPIIDDSTMTDTVRVVGGLTNNVQYYWRVKARNTEGTSGWSEVWNFRTVRLPPATPALASPPNNATNQPSTLTLRWNVVFGATSFRLEVASDSVFASTVIDDSTITTIQRDVSLSRGTKYYWRVRARNAGGSSPASVIWNFTTAQLPAQIVLVSPADSVVTSANSMRFQWRPIGNAQRYWFEFASDPAFNNRTIDSTLTDTATVVQPLLISPLWWRVRAGNAAGWGAFSETRILFSIIVSVSDPSQAPQTFELSQNYPNPFNPSTVIAFALPRESFVALEVFNLLGERVALLVEGKRPAGYYSESFNAQGLASGLYFYRLKAGDPSAGSGQGFVQTRKLVLVR